HAAARFAGPVALTANARSASLSAASTAVYAAALTQTSRSATGRAASAHSATALSTSAASVTSSSVRVNARAAGPATCNRSVPSGPPAPATSSAVFVMPAVHRADGYPQAANSRG